MLPFACRWRTGLDVSLPLFRVLNDKDGLFGFVFLCAKMLRNAAPFFFFLLAAVPSNDSLMVR